MATTAHAYNNAAKHLVNGDINFLSDTIKAMVLSAYTPSASHDTISDVLAAGVQVSATGTGYTTGGMTLASKTVTASGAVTTLDAADDSITTTTASLSQAYVVYYKDSGTGSTSYVIAWEDFGGTQTAPAGVTVTDTVPGIITITAS